MEKAVNQKTSVIVILIFYSVFANAANRYWVASINSNWNNTANWSTISGGVGGASVPVSTDVAYFDGIVGVGNCNIDVAVNINGLIISGFSGSITQNANNIQIGANGYVQSSGSFLGGSGIITINLGLFTLSGGSFTSTTNNFSIGGLFGSNQILFTHSAGTFNHNNGTLILNPISNCGSYIFTIDVIPASLFYNFVINGSGMFCGGAISKIATGAGDVVQAMNDFTHTDGFINGLFAFKNNLIIGANSDGGFGTITANGTGAQTYSVSGVSPRTCILEVNKASGALTPAVGTTALATYGFVQTLGDFTAPSGNFSIGGTFTANRTLYTHVAGIFTHNNGTVILDPVSDCGSYNYTIDVIPSTLFYNFIINGTGINCGPISKIATGAGDVVQAMNDFTHTDGFINGLFAFKNNLIIGANSDGGFGTITANGTGAQTYSVSGAAPRTCILEVNKASGALTPAVGTTALATYGFVQTLGDFTAPSGNFSIGGTFTANRILYTHVAGTFTHNNGTVVLNPVSDCGSYNYTIDVIPSTLFYNFIINGTGINCGPVSKIATGAGDVVQAMNDFTHTDGFINGLFAFKNNLIIGANSDGGFGTITANGTGAQTYSVSGAAPRTCILEVNKASGALTPAVGTTALATYGFVQTLGDFTAPSGNFSIGGTSTFNRTIYTHAAGVFTHNNGTVVLDPVSDCGNFTFNFNIIPTTAFYNVIFNGSNVNCGSFSIFSIAASDTIDVDNNLTLSNGQTLNNFIECQGNVTIQSTFDAGNTTKLILNGNNNTTITATGATTLFDGKVVISKQQASKTVTLLSSLQLDAAAQTITFTKGRIISSLSNLLIIGDNVTVASVTDSSYVYGPVRKIGNDAFVFPTGKTSVTGKYYYRSIAIAAPGLVTDHFTAEYFSLDPDPIYTTTSKDITLDHVSRCEYWILDRTNGASNVNVTLSWRDSTSCGVTNLPDLRVARWNGTTWKDHGNGAAIGTINGGTLLTSAAVTAFSPFTLASATSSNPLPIELVSFTATPNDDRVDLNWQTATELNNDYFTIEKSVDAVNFSTITAINGAGNSTSMQYYYTPDLNPSEGISYYRLKQTDFDGRFKYAKMVAVEYGKYTNFGFELYPNPNSVGNTNIVISSGKGAEVLIIIRDAMGKELYSKLVYTSTNGNNTVILDDSLQLALGVYYVTISSNQGTETKKYIKK